MADDGASQRRSVEKRSNSDDDSIPSTGGIADEVGPCYLHGWRLRACFVTVCAGLFLASIEVSIVSTSLVSMSNDLHMSGQSSWIITAYLLAYTGFLIIWSQFSEVLGRKRFIILAVFVLTAASAACGAAQTGAELITFRAVQGIGGGGTYTMGMVILTESAPPAKFAKYTSIVAGVFALSFLAGPLVGGAINAGTTWRWIFWINIPIGVVIMVGLFVVIPNRFPYHALAPGQTAPSRSFRRLDVLGAGLFLAAATLLVASLEEADVSYPWRSGAIISMLVISGLCWAGFLLWEYRVSRGSGAIHPMLPWRLLDHLAPLGLILSTILMGAPFTSAVIQIPQRFQTLNGSSPLQAGIQLLPYTVSAPFGSGIGAAVVGKFGIAPTYALLAGAAFQLAGAIPFALLPFSTSIPAAQYGYQVLLGFGLGINNAIASVAIPVVAAKRDIPSTMGATVQFRILGSAIGLAVVSNVLNSHVRDQLSSLLSAPQLAAVLASTTNIGALPTPLQTQVRAVYAAGFRQQWQAVLGIIAAQVPAALLMLRRNPDSAAAKAALEASEKPAPPDAA